MRVLHNICLIMRRMEAVCCHFLMFEGILIVIMNPRLPQIAASELLVMIRGSKKTGKTSLMRRMSGQKFFDDYEPSSITQTTKVQWKPANNPDNVVTLTILDVVSNNPHLTASAQGTPQGIIILYDPQDTDSIFYAQQVAQQTPTSIPIAILANFQDRLTTEIHPTLKEFSNRCYFIATSMTTNLGLAELSHWLELPLSISVFHAYNKLHTFASKEVKRLQSMFAPGSHESSISWSSPNSNDDLGGFWSDEETDPARYYKKHRKAKSKPKGPSLIDNSVEVSYSNSKPINPEDEDLMQAIIQTTAHHRTVIGKDEIDYEPPTPVNSYNGFQAPQQPSLPTVVDNQSSQKKSREHRHKHHHKRSRKEMQTSSLPAIQLPPVSSASNFTSTAYQPKLIPKQPLPTSTIQLNIPVTPAAPPNREYDSI